MTLRSVNFLYLHKILAGKKYERNNYDALYYSNLTLEADAKTI
jgi:hypothetical protein